MDYKSIMFIFKSIFTNLAKIRILGDFNEIFSSLQQECILKDVRVSSCWFFFIGNEEFLKLNVQLSASVNFHVIFYQIGKNPDTEKFEWNFQHFRARVSSKVRESFKLLVVFDRKWGILKAKCAIACKRSFSSQFLSNRQKFEWHFFSTLRLECLL